MSAPAFWPTADDYRQVIQNLRDSAEDEELRAGHASLNARRKALLWSGNFAAVFRIECPQTGNTWALKCFTKPVPRPHERYRQIATKLRQAELPFTVDFQYLEQGLRVRDQWFPVVKMRWVEGLTLNRYVEESLEKPETLRRLLDLWPKLASRLRADIAHADLQHGNILAVPTAAGLSLKLIDYDGMYVPSLSGTRSGEVGHAAYQHPQRLDEGTYNGEVDRFSHLVIYTSIRCLLLGRKELWQQFNNGDNLLFREADFRQPGASTVFQSLWDLGDEQARAMVGRLVLACGQRLEDVPWLDHVVDNGRVRSLSRNEHSAVEALLAGKGGTSLSAAGKGGTSLSAAKGVVPQSTTPFVPQGVPPGPVPLALPVPPSGTAPLVALGTQPLAAPVAAPPLPPMIPPRATAGAPSSAHDHTGRASGTRGGLPLRALRWLDGLLAALVGPDNAILHNFLRLMAIVVLIGLGVLGWTSYRQWQAQAADQSAAVQAAAQEAARQRAADEATQQEEARKKAADLAAAQAAAQKKVELEAAKKKAEQEAANKMAAELAAQEAARKKAEMEAAQKRPTKEIAVDLGNGVKLDLILIPAGSFMMGDAQGGGNEKPVHRVNITKPFYFGKYLVTQEQWQAVMGNNPSHFKGPKNPVETVSWDDCQVFLERLGAKVGGGKFSLPTEAQWEYACRAGSSTKYCFGDDESELGEYAWYTNNSGSTTHRVGEKKPNAWGLYDMHGNLWQWCADWYDGGYYANSPVDDPTGPSAGSDRVNRGGSWNGSAWDCRSADRNNDAPGYRNINLGLRVLRAAAE